MAFEEILIGLVVVAIALLVFVLLRVSRPPATIPEQKLSSIEQNVTRLTSKTESMELRTENLASSVVRLAKETAVIGERTNALPETLSGLSERTSQIPVTAKSVTAIEEKLKRLAEIDIKLDEIRGTFLSERGRGKLGGDAVREILSAVPEDLWDEEIPMAGGRVDFGVKMPDGRILPIDSKAGGAGIISEIYDALDKLEQVEDEEKEDIKRSLKSLRRKLQDKIKAQAKKIADYAKDPNAVPAVIQAVPDPIFDYVDAATKRDCAKMCVEVVPYSLLLPFISCVRRQHRYGEADVQRIMGSLERVRSSVRKVEDLVTNSIERPKKTIENAIPQIRTELLTIASLLVSLDAGEEPSGEEEAE